MKKKELADGVEYTINEPSEKALIISDALCDVCKKVELHPDEIFPILGEAIIRTLIPVADTLGYDRNSYIHCFGKGLATVEMEFNNEHDDDEA